MKQNDNLSPIEKIERNRRITLVGFIGTFSCWQIGQLLTLNFSDSVAPTTLLIFHLLTLIGGVGWAGFSYFLYRSIGLLKQHPELKPQLDDERNSLIRLKALSYGFTITLGTASLFFGLSLVIDSIGYDLHLSGTFVAQTIMLIGILSALISYLVLDHRE